MYVIEWYTEEFISLLYIINQKEHRLDLTIRSERAVTKNMLTEERKK